MATPRRLVLASALMLFLELVLIRWLGANVVHLSYFANFVLLGSFLGIGLGFLVARTSRRWLPWSVVVLATLAAVVRVVPVTIDRSSDDVIYFTSLGTSGPPAWVSLPVIFAAVAAVLAGPAEAVGRCFKDLPPLGAYRLDLLGSLAGVAAFAALSLVRAPSVVWGAAVALGFLSLMLPRPPAPAAAATLVLVGLLALESLSAGVSWSPYYKVRTTDRTAEFGSPAVEIQVNGVPHQLMVSTDYRLQTEPQYGLPYERLPDNTLGRVLVIGAGSGSDVAVALAQGARHVDAVEIDPRILQIGQELHPDRPYQDPRVRSVVDDGRAFLERTDQTYDLILFALPDSLALVTGASAIRLESYLFTREAAEAARSRLRPGGGFALYNYYREDRLVDRLGGTVADAFGHDPCIDRVGTAGVQAVIAVAVDADDQQCDPAQAALPVGRTPPATDDRPFLYFFGSSLPSIYVFALALILLVSLVSVRALGGPLREMRPYADLFFLGAAFLLLETKNVTSFALLFGTTWIVNAIVFAGVLVAVLLAVEVTMRWRTPPLKVVYAGVAITLAVAYAVPNSALLALPVLPRLVAAVALAFAPVFLANVAFAKRFAVSEDSRAAFAVNIIGAMVGGAMEYLGLLTGYRNLLVLAGLLYLAAFALSSRAALGVRDRSLVG